MNAQDSNIVIVSNRLPLVIKKDGNSRITMEQGQGGLVTAMAPVLKNRNGTWIGWPGYHEEDDPDGRMQHAANISFTGYRVLPVALGKNEIKKYYEGFSNSVLWPLFHGFSDKCRFLKEDWETYESVNEKFAQAVCDGAGPNDFVWIHDYQLIRTGHFLRQKNRHNRTGFFLHIPFPPYEVFARCPWRYELLSAMLKYDLIGFHTIQHKRNFIRCLRKIIRKAEVDPLAEYDEAVSEIRYAGRNIRAGVFPISIDYQEFIAKASEKEVRKRLAAIRHVSPDVKFLLGVDRLDYTKGIPEKLAAFRNFLHRYPAYREKVHFIQIVVPSRKDISAYADLKCRIDQLAGEINGEFGTNGWMPVHYMYRSLDRTELVALYQASHVAYIMPLKDGMNLVAKEYCACNLEENGVLMLSEFAGAAHQFYSDAILANPHDSDQVAEAIRKALCMPPEEKQKRMKNLRQNVRTRDIFWWLNNFLDAAIGKDLSSFPEVDEYFPLEPFMDAACS